LALTALPAIRAARLANTSLTFMLVLVPEPVETHQQETVADTARPLFVAQPE